MFQRQCRGFSLPELFVVIAIIMLFSTTALPALAQFIDKMRAQAYVRQFSQHLAFARVAATSSNLQVRLCPAAEGMCNGNWRYSPLQILLLQPDNSTAMLLKEIPAIHSEHNLSYHRQAITFRRDGSLNVLENGTFFYCGDKNSDWHYKLTLNQAGRSRLLEIAAPCPI